MIARQLSCFAGPGGLVRVRHSRGETVLGSYSCRPRSWQLSQSQSQSSFVAILFVVIPATRNGDGSPSRRTLGSRPKGGSKGAGSGTTTTTTGDVGVSNRPQNGGIVRSVRRPSASRSRILATSSFFLPGKRSSLSDDGAPPFAFPRTIGGRAAPCRDIAIPPPPPLLPPSQASKSSPRRRRRDHYHNRPPQNNSLKRLQ